MVIGEPRTGLDAVEQIVETTLGSRGVDPIL